MSRESCEFGYCTNCEVEYAPETEEEYYSGLCKFCYARKNLKTISDKQLIDTWQEASILIFQYSEFNIDIMLAHDDMLEEIKRRNLTLPKKVVIK